MVVLMATLFWALWDEDFGQRPWKTFQHEWKDRYSTFLKTARSQSSDSQKDVESSPDYQKLKQDCENASQNAAPRIKEINERLRELSAQILAVQDGFTDRRAYVSASRSEIETGPRRSAKQRRRTNPDEHEEGSTAAGRPDG